jgi:hypothetical protein
MKSLKLVTLMVLFTIKAFAQIEKTESYLFTCPINDGPVFQQIAVKFVTVLEKTDQYQYFVIDVEGGNGVVNDLDGQGHHMKFLKTLTASQNATEDSFIRTPQNDYILNIRFDGTRTSSDLEVYFELLNNGLFALDFRGRGPLMSDFSMEFDEVMADSNIYSLNQSPECFSHPNLRNFLD